MSTHTSTHAARNTPDATPQVQRSLSEVAARNALFASPDVAAPSPVLQATWRASGAPCRAVAFWPQQNDDAIPDRDRAPGAATRDEEAIDNGEAKGGKEATGEGQTPSGDLLAICDESGVFRLERVCRAPIKNGAPGATATPKPPFQKPPFSLRASDPLPMSSPNALCVALSPFNRLLAVGQEDGAIQVKGASLSRRESRQNQIAFKAHEGAVKVLAWSGSAPLVASGGSDGVVRLWDIENPKRRQILTESEQSVTALAWSQDGHWLAAGDDLGAVSVWNVRGVGNEVLGARNASGARDGVGQSEIRVADFRWTKTRHEFWISALCFAPNGLALASGGYDGTARIWSCDNGFELQLLEGHSGVVAAAFAPDNRTLCCGGSDGALKLWDSWTGQSLHSLPPLDASVCALAFAPRTLASPPQWSNAQTQTLAAATSREVQIWRW